MDHRANDPIARPRRALHDRSSSHFWSSDDEDGTDSPARDGLSQSERGFSTHYGLDGTDLYTISNPSFRGPPRMPRYRRRHKRDESHTPIHTDDDAARLHDAPTDDPSVMTEWSLPSDSDVAHHNGRTMASGTVPPPPPLRQLTEHDIALCQALDLDYERALEDRQVAWTARYQSVRQSTLASIAAMVLLILVGTTVFLHQADSYWSVSEGLLFSIYTITTVGYGHLDMPSTAIFQVYVILYIFVGIAMLTILVAQVYQCLALEASRVVTDAGDAHAARRNSMRVWLEARTTQNVNHATNTHDASSPVPQPHHHPASPHGTAPHRLHPDTAYTLNDGVHSSWDWADVAVWLLDKWDRLRNFLRYNEFGRGVSVVLPFAVLIAIGAGVIGPLEGWSPIEATYFAVVSLTTVGFGDYYPTRTASIWFCCLWLPFSVGFMSLYLANVAAFYIRISDRNVARIGRILRKRLHAAKERAEQERRAVLKRALRGQSERAATSGTDNGNEHDVDAVAVATRAAEAAQRPLVEVLEGITVITVDHSQSEYGNGLRQAAHRMRGFDTIPTLDTNTDLVAVGPDEYVDVESPRRQPSQTSHGGNRASALRNGPVSYQRERILQNNLKHMELVSKSKGVAAGGTVAKGKARATMTMKTMKDVLGAVHRNNKGGIDALNDAEHSATAHRGNHRDESRIFQGAGDESEFLSVRSSRTVLHHDRKTVRKKPSFALRVLVQERFAEIIAADVAGFQSSMEIKDYTLAVTIDSLKDTAEKWLVPRRARKAFRAVAFEALYFVGEHGLITRGSEALFSLTPFEFHELFSPLLAAFGDAETMELWLERTQPMAEVDFIPSTETRGALSTLNAPKANRILQASRSVPATVAPTEDVKGTTATAEQTSPSSEVTSPSTAGNTSAPMSPCTDDGAMDDLPAIT